MIPGPRVSSHLLWWLRCSCLLKVELGEMFLVPLYISLKNGKDRREKGFHVSRKMEECLFHCGDENVITSLLWKHDVSLSEWSDGLHKPRRCPGPLGGVWGLMSEVVKSLGPRVSQGGSPGFYTHQSLTFSKLLYTSSSPISLYCGKVKWNYLLYITLSPGTGTSQYSVSAV